VGKIKIIPVSNITEVLQWSLKKSSKRDEVIRDMKGIMK